jgi:Cu-Zn family superoxide dismutase
LGLAAGGHFDPLHSNQHRGPYEQDGHLGDLPPLYSDEQHKITGVVLAPRLTLDMIAQRSLIIHQYGDNFSDHPEPLGGGNARIACGIIR